MKFIRRRNLMIGGCALMLSACFMACVAPAKADFPKPIAPPKSESIAPLGRPSAVKLPAQTAIVEAVHRHVPTLIEQMLQGKLTPQKAWDEKLLNVDDLLWIFTSHIDPWGSFNWKFNVQVRRGLAALLAQHGADKVAQAEKLPPNVRLWLTDYYQSIGDEKAIVVGESILKEIKTPIKSENSLVFQTVERLAWYYNGKRNYKKSAETWLRMEHFYEDTGWWVPDAIFWAARMYLLAGNRARAWELFARVPEYNNGFFSGMSRFDQAGLLLSEGKIEEARQLLKQPLTGDDADRVRVAILASLGRSYYLTGNFAEARQYSQESLKLYKAQRARDPEATFGLAQQTLQLIEQWSKEPIFCEPKTLDVAIKEDDKSPIILRLALHTFRKIPLILHIDSPSVTVQLAEFGWSDETIIEQAVDIKREIVVRVRPETILEGLDATLTISSPESDFQAKIPIRIRRN
jgi:tetratricopeptide (TPR) repeat protein